MDLVAAQVPVTPELEKHVDFSDPTRTNVNQILVTGPGAPAIASIEDLSGREVFARETRRLPPEPARAQREVQGPGEAADDDSGAAARTSRTTTCSRW